jgi:hypothetical protein
VTALLALALPACQQERWTDAQRTEAVRMCRGQFGFPGISVFESQEVTYVRFMCQCEVDWLAERIPHRTFEDRLKASEVSRLLAAGGVSCLQQLKEQGR